MNTSFILVRTAWRRPSGATRRPTLCATCDPRGATRGSCGLSRGAAHSPCSLSRSATHGPCDLAGRASCSSSARACGFSHFLTAAGHVDLPPLKFRTLVHSTVAHKNPALTIIGARRPSRRPIDSNVEMSGRARFARQPSRRQPSAASHKFAGRCGWGSVAFTSLRRLD